MCRSCLPFWHCPATTSPNGSARDLEKGGLATEKRKNRLTDSFQKGATKNGVAAGGRGTATWPELVNKYPQHETAPRRGGDWPGRIFEGTFDTSLPSTQQDTPVADPKNGQRQRPKCHPSKQRKERRAFPTPTIRRYGVSA